MLNYPALRTEHRHVLLKKDLAWKVCNHGSPILCRRLADLRIYNGPSNCNFLLEPFWNRWPLGEYTRPVWNSALASLELATVDWSLASSSYRDQPALTSKTHIHAGILEQTTFGQLSNVLNVSNFLTWIGSCIFYCWQGTTIKIEPKRVEEYQTHTKIPE